MARGEDLIAILTGIEGDIVAVSRLSCAALANMVVTETPVLTGSARASWRSSIGPPLPGNVTISIDNPAPVRYNHTAVANKLQPGDKFSLANGKDYILPLEDGWSQKARFGMMSKNVAQWQRFVDAASRQRGGT